MQDGIQLSLSPQLRARLVRYAELRPCTNAFIDARLRIDADGRVGSSEIRIVPAASTGCLFDALTQLKFPPPIDGQASVDLRLR